MSKGSKEALTVLIVTYVTHVERVESGVCGLCTQYRYIQCYVERVERLCYVETRDKHIFAITITMYVEAMLKGSKVKITFNPLTYIAMDLSFPKLFFGSKIS